MYCFLWPQESRPSTTPLRHWGYRHFLPISWTTLRGKHCMHLIAIMGVVDTFGPVLITVWAHARFQLPPGWVQACIF